MLRLTLMMMMLSLARGQGGHTDPPQPCCIGHQFTAILGEWGVLNDGHLIRLQGTVMMTADYDAKLMLRQGSMKRSDQDTASESTVLQDYNTNTQYVTSANGDCVSMPIPPSMPLIGPCIAANATLFTRINFGSGHDTLEVIVWEFKIPDDVGGSVDVKLAVSADNCTPVLEERFGLLSGHEGDITYVFANFQPSISDRSLLAIPAAGTCHPRGGPAVGR